MTSLARATVHDELKFLAVLYLAPFEVIIGEIQGERRPL